MRPDTPRLTIGAAIDLYLSLLPTMVNRLGRLYMPRTVSAYTEALRPFDRWCGDRPITELSAELVQQYLGELRRRGLAQWTLSTWDKVLRIWPGWCVERGIIGRSPVERVRRLAAVDPPIEMLSGEDVGRLLGACNRLTWGGSRDAAILFALWRTGVRASELARLELEDYDRRGRLLRVRHGKGDAHRVVGVPDDAAAAIDEFVILMRGEEAGPLFPSDGAGRSTGTR